MTEGYHGDESEMVPGGTDDGSTWPLLVLGVWNMSTEAQAAGL